MKVYEVFGGGADEYRGARGFLAGVECEIEAVKNPNHHGIFSVTKDGSLRNNGYEFISSPARKDELVAAFTDLHEWLDFMPKQDPFSVRTSTHVHVNCLNLETDHVRTLVLLYALFEDFFFMMVKPNRKENIHCVPLTWTNMPALYKRDLQQYVKNWHKYTALNLRRLVDLPGLPALGTVEFRHLHGTGDAEEFDTWLSVLENLWKLCQHAEITQQTLTTENILKWFDTIFAPAPAIVQMRVSLFEIIRNSLIDVKFSV